MAGREGEETMFNRRFAVVALALSIAAASMFGGATVAHAGEGTIQMKLVKAAFIVGGTGGSGTLNFAGQSYPLSVGGLSAGFSIALSEVNLDGKVKNINRPEDIEGIYSAAGAGLSVVAGGNAAVMVNGNGVTIEVSGTQVGVDFSLNLQGLSITLKR
jgi:hypothetical protein